METRFVDRLQLAYMALSTAVCVAVIEPFYRLVPRRARREFYCRVVRIWGRIVLAGHRLSIEGAERIPKGEPLVIVSNHQSNVDIPLLHAVLPVIFRWMSRDDLFRAPLLGLALRRMGAIEVFRGDKRRALGSLRLALDALAAGEAVVIFPEGTWGDAAGRMRSFKAGALTLVRRSRARIVPLTILGSCEVNPPFTNQLHRGPLRVVVHDPLPPPTDDEDDDAFLERLRAIIASRLPHGNEPAEPRPAFAGEMRGE